MKREMSVNRFEALEVEQVQKPKTEQFNENRERQV
jgi:hypothetical protein